MDRGLVILLHGVGSNGANMAALGQAMAPALPGFVFESPDARRVFIPCLIASPFNSAVELPCCTISLSESVNSLVGLVTMV